MSDDQELSDPAEDGVGLTSRLSGLSRRAFLRAGGLGVAAVGAAAAIPGLPALLSAGESDAPAATGAAEDASGAPSGLVARVVDASAGELHLYFGEEQVVVKDPGLVNRLAQAAGGR